MMSLYMLIRKFIFLIFARITKKIILPDDGKDATIAIQAIVDGKDVYDVYGRLMPKYTIPNGHYLLKSTINVKKGVDIVFGTGTLE